MEYRYIKGGPYNQETVEFNINQKDGSYVTTCVVNIDLLLCGIFRFPCGNGDDVTLTDEQHLDILKKVKQERQKYADVPVKTLKSWHDSGIRLLEDYIRVGDTVDADLVYSLLNCVPPVTFCSYCIQVGEAHNHLEDDQGKLRATYATFHKLADSNYEFDGYCFKDENTDRANKMTKLDMWLGLLEGNNENR